jgi:amphi-Trp domain-containing protein
MDFGAAVGFRLALRHPKRLSAIIVQNAPLHPWEPRGWWATLGQYWADGSAAHRQAARSYLDLDGLRGQYLSGVQDPSLIDPDNWVIDKALIDRPGVDEIMLDLLYDIPNQAPTFKAMQELKNKTALSREQAAARLRAIADELASGNDVVIEREDMRLVAHVPDQVNLKVEFEIEDDGTELEIELTW